MPEGDTVWLTAAILRDALVGKALTRCDIRVPRYAAVDLTGGKLFHLLSGNLSFQIEHHLFPDIPAHRHAEISEEVQAICKRYGIPYNTGSLPRQFATVVRKIFKLALPGSHLADRTPEADPISAAV